MLGAQESDRDEFKAIVDETVAELLENGADQETLAAVCQNRRFSVELSNGDPGRGLAFAEDVTTRWAHDGDVTAYQTEYEVFDKLSEYVESGAFDAIFRKYMTNPARSVLLVTVTEPGLQEQQDAELAQKLADMKAAMTDEELDALIARTADFTAWTEENANSTMIDQMKAVSAQDLPEELTVYTAETKDADGVRMITSTADIGDLAAVGMVLDTSAVPADQAERAFLLCDAAGQHADGKLHGGAAANQSGAADQLDFHRCGRAGAGGRRLRPDADGAVCLHEGRSFRGDGAGRRDFDENQP